MKGYQTSDTKAYVMVAAVHKRAGWRTRLES